MNPSAPLLSIVVVTYRCGDLVRACLASLAADALMPPAPGVEVVVVDSGSGDATPDVVAREFPRVDLVRCSENVGFARGNNLGLERARGRHVLLLNPDTVVPPGAIGRLVAYLEEHPRAGAVGPRLLCGDGSPQIACQSFPSLRIEVARQLRPIARRVGLDELGDREPSTAGRVDWVSGACLLLRREALDAVGPLDPRFFLYYEETDWCLRAGRAGFEVHYVPEIAITHFGGQSAAASGQTLRSGRVAEIFRESRRHYFSKHHGALAAAAVEGVHALRGAVRATKSALGLAPVTS